jgi:hypothetical protein
MSTGNSDGAPAILDECHVVSESTVVVSAVKPEEVPVVPANAIPTNGSSHSRSRRHGSRQKHDRSTADCSSQSTRSPSPSVSPHLSPTAVDVPILTAESVFGLSEAGSTRPNAMHGHVVARKVSFEGDGDTGVDSGAGSDEQSPSSCVGTAESVEANSDRASSPRSACQGDSHEQLGLTNGDGDGVLSAAAVSAMFAEILSAQSALVAAKVRFQCSSFMFRP